jgi:hypothetical protein
LAHQRLRRQAGYTAAVAALAGPTGLAADAIGQFAVAARLTLHLAAAHGLNPNDTPARATDLLVLTRIHSDVAAAQQALAAATVGTDGGQPPISAARPFLKRMAASLVGRGFPLIGPAIAFLAATNTVDDIVRRARSHFA